MYLDLIVLLNFSVDYLLLLGTFLFWEERPNHLRLLAAAALGAIYSGASLVPGFGFLGGVHWRLICLGLMSAAAFGTTGGTLQKMVVFCFLSFALGGVATLVSQGGGAGVLLCAAGVCGLCRLLVGWSGKGGLVRLNISLGEKRLSLTALKDTGNTLRDPITGEKVLVLGLPEAEKLTGLTAQQLQQPMKTLQDRPLSGLRLIPYHAVGQEGGLMLGMRIREVTINGRTAPIVVAFAPNRLGNTQYQALLGGFV